MKPPADVISKSSELGYGLPEFRVLARGTVSWTGSVASTATFTSDTCIGRDQEALGAWAIRMGKLDTEEW